MFWDHEKDLHKKDTTQVAEALKLKRLSLSAAEA